MPRPQLTRALEDYLETIALLVRDEGYARVRDIAKARDVKAGSVSPALKRLSELGLIDYEQREYIRLTPAGGVEARRVFARHQLLMRFFGSVLQMSPEAAEEEACSLEHNLSDDAMERLARFFEFMTVCPHGDPGFLDRFHACSLVHPGSHNCSADNDGACVVHPETEQEPTMSVYDLKPGQSGLVTQVSARGAIRQRLLDMGVLPHVEIEVERIAPSGDPVWIKLLGFQLALRRAEAEAVHVTPA